MTLRCDSVRGLASLLLGQRGIDAHHNVSVRFPRYLFWP
jgi:hypothetical protein